ncbi:RbsD/FucU family protein [Xylanimonas sp. McL0601]|uniref:RbsD/FucU family protein n=1 Tax=Xylanimonas sp. McL0601 TaxID=3414739 RepID=UPI003CEAF800
MLLGLDPLLTGDLLAALDAMGHSDALCLADAHFPADRLANRLLDFPGITTPGLLRAVCTVLPLDDAPAVDLMQSADGEVLPVQHELAAAAGVGLDGVRLVERHDFYDLAGSAYLIVRTGETRTYGNVIVRKGVVPAPAGAER